MILLDTQHVSQLQRAESRDAAILEARLRGFVRADVRITVITPYEQLRRVLGRINAARSPSEQIARFGLLLSLLEHYAAEWSGRILPFDERAAQVFQGFEARLVRRIGSRDAWIAAIALAHGATLVTGNTSDFRQVPGLTVEDWLLDEGGSESSPP